MDNLCLSINRKQRPKAGVYHLEWTLKHSLCPCGLWQVSAGHLSPSTGTGRAGAVAVGLGVKVGVTDVRIA